jgi:16S rRNA processing protein RimM
MPVPYRRLGRVVKTHGTDGEVSVMATEDLTVVCEGSEPVWIVPPPEAGAVSRTLTAVRTGPRGQLVRLSGIDTAALAHEIVGRWLLVAGAGELQDDQEQTLVGLEVVDRVRGGIGTVTDVIVTGANDVLVVTGGPFGEVLVPVIGEVIRGVDEAAGTIDVVLLEGLIEGDQP